MYAIRSYYVDMIRSGQAQTVLAGGADALCRMTCFGFQSLQVVDPAGARPFDEKRSGMSVAEGAGLLLLVSQRPENPIAELSGGGLSCDAFHASSPHVITSYSIHYTKLYDRSFAGHSTINGKTGSLII